MARVDPRNRERYELPAIWEPGEDWCVCVRIPGTSDHLATLADHLDLLTWSNMYARDNTRRGAAIVARRWQSALNSAPIARCTGGLMLRQNPENPCQLQQSTDNGESWTLAFDYSLCGAVDIPPLYTEMDPETNRLPDEQQLDSYLWFWRSLLAIGVSIAEADGTVDDVKAALRSAWGDATGTGAGALLDPLAAAIIESDTAERESVLDPATWKPGRDVSLCRTRKYVVEPDDNRTWLARVSENIAQWLRNLSSDIARTLSYAVASVVGQPLLAYRLLLAGASEDGGGAGWGWTGPTECIDPTEGLPDAWEWETGLQGWRTVPREGVTYHWQPGAIGCTTTGGWRIGLWTIAPPDGYTWHCEAGATVNLEVLHRPSNAFLNARVNYKHVPGLPDSSSLGVEIILPHNREIISIEISAQVYNGTAWFDALHTTGLYQQEVDE